MNKIYSIIFGYDFIGSVLIFILSLIFMPSFLHVDINQNILEIVLSVLSIIFGLTFAGFSILISTSDDDYINFLNKHNVYNGLIWVFKVTIYFQFITISYSILVIIFIKFYNYFEPEKCLFIHKTFLSIAFFLASYSLISTIMSIGQVFKFSTNRGVYLKIKEEQRKKEKNKD